MAEQVIITRFVGDDSNLTATIDNNRKAIDGYVAETQKAVGATDKLDASVGDASKKIQVLASQGKSAAAEVGNAAKSAQKVVDTATKSSSGLGGLFTKLKGSVSDFGSKLGGIGTSIKSNLGDAIKSAGSSIGGFGTSALTALGPIGIAVAALGAGLIKVFSNTDAGATYFDGLKRAGGIAFDKITGLVTGFFDTLTDGQTVIGKVFGYLGDAISFVTAPLRGLVSLIGDLTGISDALAEANKEGQELANLYDNIDQAQYQNIKSNAELERQVSALNIKLRDRTLSDKERLDIASQLTKAETERGQKEIEILAMTTAAKKREAELELKNKGEVSDETARALAEAQAAEIKADQASAELRDRAAVRVNQINEDTANKSAAIRAKEKAQDEKAAAEKIKLAQDVAAATAKAGEAQAAAIEEQRRAALSPEDLAKDDIELRYAKELKAAQDAFAALRKLQAGNATAQAEIDQQIADTSLTIEENKIAALEALKRQELEVVTKGNEEKLEAIRQATQSEAEIRREAIEKQFDELEANAQLLITNEEDRTDTLVGLEQARADALREVKTDAQLKDEQDLKESQDRQVAIIQSVSGQLNSLLEDIASGQIKNAKEVSNAIIGITLDTVGAIVQAEIVALIARSTSFGAQAGPVGAAIGLAGGTALGAILKGLLNALKSSIAGNYEGDPYVEGTPTWGGRDGHLRRLDTGERVVTAKDNAQHWDMLEAMRTGKMGQWLEAQNADMSEMMALNFAPRVNAYMDTDGARMANSQIALPRYFDRNMVDATLAGAKEQRKTNELLAAMLHAPRTSKRYR